MATQAVILAASLPFLPALWGDYVFDDWESVVNNPVVNGKAGLQEVLWSDFWGRELASPQSHKSYRPLTSLLFRLQWTLFHGQAQYFHPVGLLLHVLVSYLLLKTFQLMEKKLEIKQSVATAGGIAFALHPVHTEAIANITCQCELLSALFVLLGLLFYISHCPTLSPSRIGVLLFLALASVLAKEQGIALLPICCVLAVLLKRRFHLWLLASLTVCLAGWRFRIGGGRPHFSSLDNPPAFVESPILRWLSFSWQWLLHLKLLVAPFQLCFDYSMGCVLPITSYTDPRIGAILLAGVLLPSGAYKLYQTLTKGQQRLFLFAILFGGIAFFPASNILITVGFPVAERVLYLPSIGICLIFGILWKKLEKLHGKMDSHVLVIVLLAAVLCFERCREWTTEIGLYSSGLKVCPTNAKIHYNLAKVLADQGRTAEAEKEYREALSLRPHYEQALNNLGNLLEKRGRFNESEHLLRAAVQSSPQFATAWMNLGITMMNAGRYNESVAAYEESLRLRPTSADCYFNLGNLYQKMRELELALEAWRRAVSLKPSHCPSWTNFFVVLEELDRCSTVLALEPSVLVHCSSTAAVRSQLGVCHAHEKNYLKAEEHFLAAIALAPSSQVYRSNYDVLRGFKYRNNRKMT